MKEQRTFDVRKALLLPVNSKGELFIQDRRGHKKLDWGFFGGGIEGDETPFQAVIRESKEELCIDLHESDLAYLGTSETDWNGHSIIRYLYLYRTDQKEFDVREGKGGHWLPFTEVRNRMDDKDRFDEVVQKVKSVSQN